MNTMFKTSLITGLLLIAFQNSHANELDTTSVVSKDSTQESIDKGQTVLPPPSPFFSSNITSFIKSKVALQNIEENADITIEDTLGSNSLKSRIEELELALKSNQEQATNLVEELHATAKNADFENEMYEKTVSQLQEKITKLSDKNKTLASDLVKTESSTDSQQGLLSSLKQESIELNELKNSYLQRKEEVSSLKKQIAYFDVLREQSSTTDAKVKTLEDAYTVISQEAEELKKNLQLKEDAIVPLQTQADTQKTEIASLNEKLSSFEQTQAELNDLQSAATESNDNSVLLKAKIVELDDVNKSLKSQLGKMQQDASQQTRKLGLLDQSSAELTALKSAYKERNDEASALKKELIEIDDNNISLGAEIGKLKAEASESTRKLELFDQATAELTALKSAYKDRNDQASTLKEEGATLKELNAELDDSNKTLLSKIEQLGNEASQNTRKLGLLDQSTAELTAIKSAYKERNDEAADLKDLNTELGDANKILISRIDQLNNDANQNTKKLGLLDQSTTELADLKSAYKEQNDEATNLKDLNTELGDANKILITRIDKLTSEASQNTEKLGLLDQSTTELDNSNKTLLSKIAQFESEASQNTRKLGLLDKSTSELAALKSAYKERNDEAASLKAKIIELDNSNKTLLSKISQLESAASQNTRKLGLLDKSTVELTALKSAYKDRNDENVELKKKMFDNNKSKQTLSSQISQLTGKLNEQVTLKSSLNKTSTAALSSLQKKLDESENLRKSLSSKIGILETNTSNQKRQLTTLSSTTQELESLKNAYKDLKDEKLAISKKFTAAMLDTDKDGVVSELDQCLSSPLGSSVDNVGCPEIDDADGDKIADANDLCPNTSSNIAVNQFGCAANKSITLIGVNFTTGSDRLTPSSLPIINTAATALKGNPSIKVEVAGYTDNLGGETTNRQLSKRRANAVAIQLIEQGVKAARISTKGYGESSPIASNSTKKGRLENRRVELKIR